MLGGFIALIILVAIVASQLHVSTGWAWIIVLVAIGAFFVYRSKNPLPYRRITKMGAVFSSVCPYCHKHTKSRAVVCHHCGRDLVVKNT